MTTIDPPRAPAPLHEQFDALDRAAAEFHRIGRQLAAVGIDPIVLEAVG